MKTYKTRQELIDAVKKWGSYGKLRTDPVSNNWNAELCGIFYNEQNDSLWVEVYVQGGNTDTNTSINYRYFIKCGDVCGETELHGFRYRFTESQREEFLKKLSDQIDRLNAIPQESLERNKRINWVKSYKFINPAVDKLYDLLRLQYSNYMYKRDPKYDAYCAAEKALNEYIDEHIDEIIVMENDAIHTLYWNVLYDAYKKVKQ